MTVVDPAAVRHRGSRTVHGGTGTDLYTIWNGMLSRCHNPTDKSWKRYGGRGIYVCARWRASFPAFRDDMGVRPSKRHSIERRDNDGPYSPENCVWATAQEQDRNKRSNVWITRDGRTLIVSDWAREFGLSPAVVQSRLRIGWDIERALRTPVHVPKAVPKSEASLQASTPATEQEGTIRGGYQPVCGGGVR